MASSSTPLFVEGHCTTSPSLFSGTNYTQWRIRMRLHIRSIDDNLWNIVEQGNFVPMNNSTGLAKEEEHYTAEDENKLSLNDKALNILFCPLDSIEFIRVLACETAKDAWEILQTSHEGTSQVKESKIEMSFHDYELFEMKTKESITDMYKRFSNLINDLKGPGKSFVTLELVKKILCSLSESWTMKVTAIEESKDLTKMKMDEVIDSLLTFEMKRKPKEEENKPKRGIALKTVDEEEDGNDSFMEENEINFLAKRLEGTKDCPQAKWKKNGKKDKFYKKKVFSTTWSESGDSRDEDESNEEQANLCFMAKEDDSERDFESKVCLEATKLGANKWFIDSGCSRHMMGDKSLFTSLKPKNGGNVTFGDNSKEKIIGIGSISNKSLTINENTRNNNEEEIDEMMKELEINDEASPSNPNKEEEHQEEVENEDNTFMESQRTIREISFPRVRDEVKDAQIIGDPT
ncbi:uncharacterized protein LOC116122767 [Pistacia vera]|uniref:uncharacterized protein LOC116122767 n=1 Tax=Pistacia vera TaxID=55513 RepID=UPI0012636B64|nr:uncharacterized protein LOC116122767 [Pistacia vera]